MKTTTYQRSPGADKGDKIHIILTMKIAVFLEKQSGKWFYIFSRNWSTYRSNQGYDTKELAEKAGLKHWHSLD